MTEEEAAPTVDPRDPQGYYRLLGLDPKTSVAPEEVRSAFRKLAQVGKHAFTLCPAAPLPTGRLYDQVMCTLSSAS